jgi:signal transduction histidine kinase
VLGLHATYITDRDGDGRARGLAVLVEDISARKRAGRDERTIELIFDQAQRLDHTIAGLLDTSRLEQVAQNLLQNAIKLEREHAARAPRCRAPPKCPASDLQYH